MRRYITPLGIIAALALSSCKEGGRPMPFDPPDPPEMPYALVFDAEPHDGVAGTTLGEIRVAIVGRSGRTVKTATNVVTLNPEIIWCFGSVYGTKSVAAVEGVATFTDIRINHACSVWIEPKKDPIGGYRLFAYTSGLRPDTSRRFSIAAAPPELLVLPYPDVAATAGQPVRSLWYFQNRPFYDVLQLAVTDSLGNWTTWSGPVTVSLNAGSAGAVLSGSPVSVVNGFAVVDGLIIDKPGTGYTLRFSAPGLTSVVTQPFTVTAATP